MNFEKPFIKEQIKAQKKFTEDIINQSEERHNQKINELHLKAQDINSELIKNTMDMENDEISKLAFSGNLEEIEKREGLRNENFNELQSTQEKILDEMDKKEDQDKIIDLITRKPPSLN